MSKDKMSHKPLDYAALTYRPVTLDLWDDFQTLFTEPGIQNGCWCMWWRLRRADCQHGFGEGNRQAFKAVLESGQVPGILAYHHGAPVGWCAIAPREATATLDRSRTLKRVDDQPVWSITCFFISKPYRRKGITGLLIHAALDYARQHGAQIVEAYPLRTEITRLLPYERFMGIQSTFERVGFKLVTQRTDRRPVMRYWL
jgi:GNAT superfamily N-acetyltransferase